MKSRDQLVWENWGKRLRTARSKAALTQSQLAERLGVAQSTVSSWETGTFAPDDATKFRIADLLDRSVDELFAWPLIMPPEHGAAA